MRLMIIGPQGAGKGTQATRICAELGVPHISTGDLFRENINGDTDLGRLAKTYMDAGQLVPDEVTQQMVAHRLEHHDAGGGFLFDGFPRNTGQARWLSALLLDHQTPIERVVLLTAPDEVLVERMLARGRADDTVEAIRQRLDIYHAETLPLVEYYGDLVVLVDGVGDVDDVHERVLKALGLPGPESG
ncbi:MAG: adenylate kinase [Actinomycetota bacterium]|nr:adenylate kinase [Actinomycetota bacterium]